MLGYTDDELRHYFSDRIKILETQFNKSKEELLDDIKRWYKRSSPKNIKRVLKYSVIMILLRRTYVKIDKLAGSGYSSFATGTPTFLVKMTRDKKVLPQSLGSWEADEHIFDSYDIEKIDIASLKYLLADLYRLFPRVPR